MNPHPNDGWGDDNSSSINAASTRQKRDRDVAVLPTPTPGAAGGRGDVGLMPLPSLQHVPSNTREGGFVLQPPVQQAQQQPLPTPTMNPLTGKPFRNPLQYQKLLATRQRLPVNQNCAAVLASVKANEVTLLVGETGSGKTTQVPQMLLFRGDLMPSTAASPKRPPLRVVVTQPRRIAAVQVATRVAEELDVPLGGDEVGYCVRFDDKRTQPAQTPTMHGGVESSGTRLSFVTEGMLLQEMFQDRLLLKYDVIVIDEAHERSSDCDLLLGLLKSSILPARNNHQSNTSATNTFTLDAGGPRQGTALPPLKLVIMSATMDVQAFAHFFDLDTEGPDDGPEGLLSLESESDRQLRLAVGVGAGEKETKPSPIMTVSGRAHAVEEFHTKTRVENFVEAAVAKAVEIHSTEQQRTASSGDILVFLSSENEVGEAARLCARTLSQQFGSTSIERSATIIKLYGQQTLEEQLKAFEPAPPGMRKVIFATNIAETSVTIDGVVFVIDTGRMKQKMFYQQQRVECLVQTPISKAAAKQRSGRAGRTRPGKCFRLFTKGDWEALSDTAHPEFKRTKLTDIVLSMLRLGVDNLLSFHYVSPPSQEAVFQALQELMYLDVVEETPSSSPTGTGRRASFLRLTALGTMAGQFPVDVATARMLLKSTSHGCAQEIVSLAGMLFCGGQIFLRPNGKLDEADALRRELFQETPMEEASPESNVSSHNQDRRVTCHGDHASLLHVFDTFLAYQESVGGAQASSSALLDWCFDHFVSYRCLLQAIKIHNQLLMIFQRLELPFSTCCIGRTAAPPCRSDGRPTSQLPKRYDYPKFLKAVLEGLFLNTGFYIGMGPDTGRVLQQQQQQHRQQRERMAAGSGRGTSAFDLAFRNEDRRQQGKGSLPGSGTFLERSFQVPKYIHIQFNRLVSDGERNGFLWVAHGTRQRSHSKGHNPSSGTRPPQFVVYQELVLNHQYDMASSAGDAGLSTKMRRVSPVRAEWLLEVCPTFYDSLVAEEDLQLLGSSVLRDPRLAAALKMLERTGVEA